MTTGALQSKRILLLRPAGQAQESVDAVRRRGAEPLAYPAIEIHAPPDPQAVQRAIERLDDYDWVVFTSANGVRCFVDALSRAGQDRRALGARRVAVIGPGTANALRAEGVEPTLVSQRFIAEELAQTLLEQADLRHVLLPRALQARDVLPSLLREAGVQVEVVAVYETRPAGAQRRQQLVELLTRHPPDAVLFTSSSTVSSLAGLLAERTQELLARNTVASIGPVTTATAQQLGIRVDVTAEQHSIDGLLDALERYFRAAPAPA